MFKETSRMQIPILNHLEFCMVSHLSAVDHVPIDVYTSMLAH